MLIKSQIVTLDWPLPILFKSQIWSNFGLCMRKVKLFIYLVASFAAVCLKGDQIIQRNGEVE